MALLSQAVKDRKSGTTAGAVNPMAGGVGGWASAPGSAPGNKAPITSVFIFVHTYSKPLALLLPP